MGYCVTGLFVHSPYETEGHQDALQERAEYAARQLEIPLKQVHLPTHYWSELQKCAVVEYWAGRMLDLHLLYERLITYGAIREYAVKFLHCNLFATEHYARTSAPDDATEATRHHGVHIYKGVDQYTDDSAVLAQVPQPSLRMTLLPLGDFTKGVVSHIARFSGLGTLLTGSGQGKHRRLKELKETVFEELDPSPGVFRDLETHHTMGHHQGIHHWMVGQQVELDNRTFWVTHKDTETRDVMVVTSQDHLGLYADTLFTDLVHWTYLTPYNFFEKRKMDCGFRLRAHDPVMRCQLTIGSHNEWCGTDHIILSSMRPMKSITPGHLATFYCGEEAIGSALVLRSGPSHYTMYPTKHPTVTPTTNKRNVYLFTPLKTFYHRLVTAFSLNHTQS